MIAIGKSIPLVDSVDKPLLERVGGALRLLETLTTFGAWKPNELLKFNFHG